MLIRPFKNAVGIKWMPSLESTIQTPKILTVPRMGPDSGRQNSHLKSSRMQPRSGFSVCSDLLIVGNPGPRWPVFSRESGSLPPSPVCISVAYRPGPGASRESPGTVKNFPPLGGFSAPAMSGGRKGAPGLAGSEVLQPSRIGLQPCRIGLQPSRIGPRKPLLGILGNPCPTFPQFLKQLDSSEAMHLTKMNPIWGLWESPA